MAVACLFVLVAGCARACGAERSGPRPAAPPPRPDVQAVLSRHRVAWDETARREAIDEGKAVLVSLDCNRCHAIDDVEPASRPNHCTSCHHFLTHLVRGDRHFRQLSERYGQAVIERYQRNIEHYLEVPDLTRVGERLRPEWLARFAIDPEDLRPAMDESMVRIAAGPKERMAIARYFAAVARMPDPAVDPDPPELGPRPSPARIAEGERLFRRHGCPTCHTLGNVPTGRTADALRASGTPARLAPNLRFSRERMHRDVLVAFIRAPQAFLPTTHMPDLGLSPGDAERIADFVLFAEPRLSPTPPEPPLDPPPAVDRPVSWEEVKERVLGKVCVHCHMNDHERDRGPGNIGGFGFPGEHLRMRTYEMLVAGAGHGEHAFSVLEPRPGSKTPRILEQMMWRRREHLRDRIAPFADHVRPAYLEGEPGMPMGLPAMTDEEMGILRAWIEQGCPGPTRVTGMPGITDGYLVPDGPIGVNHGCGRRDPSEERPAWSTAPPPPWARETAPRDGGH